MFSKENNKIINICLIKKNKRFSFNDKGIIIILYDE